MKRALALLALLAGWLLVSATPASAHVEIVSSAPGDGARLSAAPSLVSVTLSENVGIQPGSIKVVDLGGRQVDSGPVFQPGDVAEQVAVRLRPGLPDGSYLVEYAFVSADSHPVRGTFAFVVGTGPLVTSAGAVSAATGTDAAVSTLSTAVRWLAYLGVVLLGGLAFVLLCRPAARTDPRARRLLHWGAGLVAVTTVATFVLQGPYAAGRNLEAVFDTGLLADTWRVAYGKLLLLRLAGVGALAVLLPGLLRPRLPDRLRARYENLAIVSGFVVLLTFSATGHPVTDPIMFVSITADLVHFGAIALWAGGLTQLALTLYRPLPGEDPVPVAARFSRLAAGSVGAIALSGAVLAVRIMPSLSTLWSTEFGLLVLLKLAGFAALLAVASRSRRAVHEGLTGTRGAGATKTASLHRLRVAVTVEVLLSAVVLALAALLTVTPPGG
ncbi:copper resistance CopC/CopD family protein [Amycolatopsis vancoresmycina]|uniref:Copper resistance protein n=1 Tax=Amycolatopsis vancoresmycina DSM 44592 TaxID=1292037 RepID=R1IAC3_9PSEU|nr:copper resistance protein CopC [Amycolatopsis vancoresmycina]EOD67354.1 copper resistance protein [Amycolatopsis vancoresmycina DSM 44592]